MSMSSFALTHRDNRPSLLAKYFPRVGCDLPEQGGISGNINLKRTPHPAIKEERPVTFNPITGEAAYKDTKKPIGACWFA